jgi:hypothetical protein
MVAPKKRDARAVPKFQKFLMGLDDLEVKGRRVGTQMILEEIEKKESL